MDIVPGDFFLPKIFPEGLSKSPLMIATEPTLTRELVNELIKSMQDLSIVQESGLEDHWKKVIKGQKLVDLAGEEDALSASKPSKEESSTLNPRDIFSGQKRRRGNTDTSPLNESDFRVYSIVNSFLHYNGEVNRDFCNQVLFYTKDPLTRGRSILPSCAFGALKWYEHCDLLTNPIPFPSEINSILASRCPFFPDKTVGETHFLTLIPPEYSLEVFQDQLDWMLNIGLLDEGIRRGAKFKDKGTSYFQEVFDQFKDLSTDSGYWALMTKDVIPGSRNKTWEEQQQMAAEYASQGYEIPSVIDSAIILLLETIQGKVHSYSQNPHTYTRCKESSVEHPDYCVMVGGASHNGLAILNTSGKAANLMGLGLIRRFF